MKKLFALMLVFALALSLTACGGSTDNEANAPAVIDMSKYPADPYDWTSTDIVNYFTEAGVFTNEDWVYVQDHPTYYAGTAVHECVGYMDEEGLVMICVFNTDPNNGETLDVDAFLQGVRDTHALPEDLSSLPMDHMVGDLIFFYSFTADETVYNAFDAAYEQLVAALGVTPDF